MWKMMTKLEKKRLKDIATRAEQYGLRLEYGTEEYRLHEDRQLDLFEESGQVLVTVKRTGDHGFDLTCLAGALHGVINGPKKKRQKAPPKDLTTTTFKSGDRSVTIKGKIK